MRAKLKSLPPAPVRVSIQDHKMTPLQEAMENLIKVFYCYSGKEGDKYKLNKKEMRNMLEAELADFLTGSNDSAVVEKIMKDLDENKDGEVDFQEFVVLVAALTVACNDFFVDSMKSCSKSE